MVTSVSALPVPQTRLQSGSIEVIKWVALAAMLVDHVNVVAFAREAGWLADAIGRLAFPMFAIVLAYNMARPGVDLVKLRDKLLLFGFIALPFHALLLSQAGGWWPVNIMFTFALAVQGVLLVKAGSKLAPWLCAIALCLGGLVVEYFWVGPVLVMLLWMRFSQPENRVLPWCVGGMLLALCVLNQNLWALLAVPLVHAINLLDPQVPRYRWAFWVGYPLHLAILLLLFGV